MIVVVLAVMVMVVVVIAMVMWHLFLLGSDAVVATLFIVELAQRYRPAPPLQRSALDRSKFLALTAFAYIRQLQVAAMKDASKTLKAEVKKIDINKVEDLTDDMADMMEDMNEINDIMGRSYK